MLIEEALAEPLVARARAATAKAGGYLRGRQSYNGAFCFYRSYGVDEPNLHDTYHAVAGFRLLRAQPPRDERLAEFLGTFPAAGVHQLYYCAFALEMLDHGALIPGPHLRNIEALGLPCHPGQGAPSSAWLEATLRALRLKGRFAELPPCGEVGALVDRLEHEGGFGEKPNIIDTYVCLGILSLLGSQPMEDRVARFVAALQQPSFGFTLTADSGVASLDVIQAGLKCCAMLSVPVRYAADIVGFTLACQTSSGGFSRSPGALPDIEQTHRALQIIAMLVAPPPA